MIKISKSKFRQDIQLIRGIAVFAVILFHFDKTIFKYGYLGVDVFFVISGFVISNLIYSQIYKKEFSFKKFFFFRFKRIIPALISYLIFVKLIIYFTVDHQNIVETTKTSLYSLFFLGNIHISRYVDYFTIDTTKNLVVNLWSLSVEEQFYIIFPIVVYFIKKYKLKNQIIIFLFFISLSLFSINNYVYENIEFLKRIFDSYDNYIFYSPITRAWEFLIGVIGMFVIENNLFFKRKKNVEVFGYLTYITLIFLLFTNFNLVNEYFRLLSCCILTTLILIFNFKINFKIKLIKFFLFTGNISYSLYLFHQGILAGLRNHNFYTTENEFQYINLDNFQNIFLVLLIIYLVSFCNFLFIEEKFRKISFFSVSKFKSLFLMIFIFISLSIISLNTNGFDFRHDDLDSFSKNNTNLEFIPGTNYIIQDGSQCINRSTIDNFCNFGIAEKNMFILGDSMISTMVSGFLTNNNLEEYKVYEATKGGCPVLIYNCDFIPGEKRFESLTSIKNSVIIMGGRYQKLIDEGKDKTEISNDLKTTIKLFTKNNNQVLFLANIPEPKINERMYFYKTGKYIVYNYENWTTEYSEFNNIIQKIDLDGLTVIDLGNLFCEETFCDFKSENEYYFLDHVHFTFFGSEIAGKEILKVLNS